MGGIQTSRKMDIPTHSRSLRKQWTALAFAALALSLPSTDSRAELLFRTAETVNGEQKWSPAKKYANPADIGSLSSRDAADGSAGRVEEVHAFLLGSITRADVDSAAVMAGLIRSGRHKLAGNAVWLASNGGDIDAGMELGRMLRKLDVFTIVGRNDQCLSACAFAFMGGVRRSVAGRLGIHRPYFPFTQETPDRQARFRYMQKSLKAFIEELDFPDSLYEAVMVVPPETMHILVPAELKRFYLEGSSPSSEDLADAASARRLQLSMYDYLVRKAAGPACTLLIAVDGRCEDKLLSAAASRGAADDPGGRVDEDSAAPRKLAKQGSRPSVQPEAAKPTGARASAGASPG